MKRVYALLLVPVLGVALVSMSVKADEDATKEAATAESKEVSTGALPLEPTPEPAPLDLEKLQTYDSVPESAVGGTAQREGFIAEYAAFDLSRTAAHGMAFVGGQFPQAVIFQPYKRVDLALEPYVDPRTGIAGSLYKFTLDDARVLYFLLGKKNLSPVNGVTQRWMIVYNKAGEVLRHPERVNYAKSLP